LNPPALEALQHGVPTVLCLTGGLKSFAHQQLGQAPEEVVRLVDHGFFHLTPTSLAAKPRPTQQEVVAECRGDYQQFFSDAAVSQGWMDVCGIGSRFSEA
jgi:hypothetical protein